MATENWQVVGDIICNPKYLRLVQPAKELPTTKFLMDFNIKVRQAQPTDLESNEEIVDQMNLSSLELDLNPHSMWEAINKELQDLQVPRQVRAAIEDPIITATRVARAHCSYDTRKYLHMEVDIDYKVGEFNGIGEYYEPRFVPASEVSIMKLEKTRVEVSSTTCTICMEEMMIGSDAICMPCSHLYHESCIVDWLRRSGVCPSCKFQMPTDAADDATEVVWDNWETREIWVL